MTTEQIRKTRQLGDRAVEVEWCVDLPIDEYGDIDRDAAKYRRRTVATIGEALAMAKQVLPDERGFGVVTVTEVEWIDPYGDGIRGTFCWEYVGDSRHYSGGEDFDE